MEDKTKRYQVNNIRIRWSKSYQKWQCKAQGLLWEEFNRSADAIRWAEKTKDFVKK